MTSHANPTMSELAGRLNPESPEAYATCKIIDESELLRDVTWLKDESSLRPISTLLRTMRSGASSLSHRQPADRREMLETLETIAVVDKKLAELNHKDVAWRAGEELPYLEAMSHNFERALFHGTMPCATERFHGFAGRYAKIDAKKADTTPNVIDAGGRGKNLTSIWLVGWSPNTCYCFYPQEHRYRSQDRRHRRRVGPGRTGRRIPCLQDALHVDIRPLGPGLAVRGPHCQHPEVARRAHCE